MGDKQRVAKGTRGVELDTSPNDSLSVSNWNYPVGSEKWRVWMETDGGGGTKIAKPPMGLGVYEGRPVVDKPGAEPRGVGKRKGLGCPVRFAWLRRLTELKLHDMTCHCQRLPSRTGLFVSARPWEHQLEALRYKLEACICICQAFRRKSETFLASLRASRFDFMASFNKYVALVRISTVSR